MPAPRKIYFVSLGCPKNQVDTEVMLGVSREEGYELVDDPLAADTLVVNTCGFIDPAKEESIDVILELARVKADARAGKKLVVTGCLSQRHSDDLAAELPEVDHFLGSADMLGLREVLRDGGRRLAVSQLDRRSYLYDHDAPRQTIGSPHTQYVKIAEGCDRPCAFCIIPALRGPQRSREISSLVREVEALVDAGAREISLIAQDLTAYGEDLEQAGRGANLERLLDALCEIDSLTWIRLHYAYPTSTTLGLIERISGYDKIASYLDVPLQHIDSGVLRSMRRGYGERAVRELVDAIRGAPAHIWLRTTLLVGHPGEDAQAFARLRDFVGEGQIDHLGVFPWSREAGTAAALFPARVAPDIAQARAAELMELQAGIRAARQQEWVGKILPVMIDGPSEESEFLLAGRHEGQARDIDGKAIICDGQGVPGEIVRARVLRTTAHDLVCTMDLSRPVDDDDEAF